MKQIPITPELSALIKERVDPDIDTSGLAIFEAIALNTKPLTGKNGTIFEKAVIAPVTLRQMADSIRNGNHLPLISDHQLMGEPKGRVFDADLFYGEGGDLQLRALFYLDPTEQDLITKLNAGSLDEVSVSFLPTQFLCSDCLWDYLGPEASWENMMSRTCANGHTIGEDGVHANLVGLSEFIELSLVARGAADNAKIVGRSQSKLQPAMFARLQARGFDTESLIVRASKGEHEVSFDTNALITQLTESQASVIDLTRRHAAAEAQVTSLTAERDTAVARVAELETELSTAKQGSRADEAEAALAFLKDVRAKLAAAHKNEAQAPETVAELIADIKTMTSDLTAILPTGGVSVELNGSDGEPKRTFVPSAFTNRKL